VEFIRRIDPDHPILIAGPTASGKSALALELAARFGGTIVNADALQVYANWRILTARPSVEDEAKAPHLLYGHVDRLTTYSVGEWVRDVVGLLASDMRKPLIVVGGTGLYFSSLINGLSHIPNISSEVRSRADALMAEGGIAALLQDLSARDHATLAVLDTANPARVQRAWEVLEQTGRGLSAWHGDGAKPVLALRPRNAFTLSASKDWLTPRIERRFRMMIEAGALDEVRANRPDFDPARPADKAIGARELMACLDGEISLDVAVERAVIATRQYAKRQRTWFRARHQDWTWLDLSTGL
jgi:tRNA dimethylallyltransferase